MEQEGRMSLATPRDGNRGVPLREAVSVGSFIRRRDGMSPAVRAGLLESSPFFQSGGILSGEL